MSSTESASSPSVAQDLSSPRLALEHYDPYPLRKVPIELWRRVFATKAGTPSNLGEPGAATIDEVAQALTHGSLSPILQDLLQTLHDLGSPAGAHILNESGVKLGLDRRDWPEAAEELAVDLWVRARADRRYRNLLLVAEVGLHERASEARYREYFGQGASTIEQPATREVSLKEALVPWFRDERMGRKVNLLIKPEDDRVVFCIFHGTRRQYEATFDDEGVEGMIGFRPLVCDVVTYEHLGGRLRVTARSKRLAELYQKAFGKVFFEDPAYFTERPRYDLDPLARAIKAGALPTPPSSSDIHRVNLVDCVWTMSDGIQYHLHGLDGQDCTRHAQHLQFPAGENQLMQAKLAFTFRNADRFERTEILLRRSNQFDCRRSSRRDAIEEYLTRIGVRTTNTALDARSEPSRSLLGIGSAARWKTLLGDRLTEACTKKLLRRVTRPSVEHDGAEGDVADDPVTQIESGDGLLTVARDIEDGGVRLVDASAMVGYELDTRQLAELLRAELQCEQPLRDLPFPGGHDLGPVRVGSVTVRPFLIMDPSAVSPQATTATLATMTGPQAKWIVLLPPRASLDDWMIAAPLRAFLGPFQVRADIVRTLGLTEQVTALERAGILRLVVDTKNRAAWLDGVLLNLSATERDLLEELARATVRGRALLATDLARVLNDDADDSAVIRKRVQTLCKSVQAQMKAAQRATKESGKIARSQKKGEGYRLVLVPHLE